jgi:hypothetical protein
VYGAAPPAAVKESSKEACSAQETTPFDFTTRIGGLLTIPLIFPEVELIESPAGRLVAAYWVGVVEKLNAPLSG